ncbi:class I lanthipeptide [Chryseobacterium sp. MYb264]|uniref:class I lanthipeptide n=1 Tax=Chryseobacterium sp. MYb264 TaxID=2745153 RepID=UPI002E0E7D54|nr:class I lanthipeptide [Chryseobacterium sp. MYb264]
MKNKKLSLNKKSITKLTNDEMNGINGGKEMFTSIFNCSKTGWTCADTCTATATTNLTNSCPITSSGPQVPSPSPSPSPGLENGIF